MYEGVAQPRPFVLTAVVNQAGLPVVYALRLTLGSDRGQHANFST